MEYDGNWKLQLPSEDVEDVDPDKWPSPYLANGKLALFPRMDPARLYVDRTFLTIDEQGVTTGGNVFGNAVQTFNFGSFDLFRRRGEEGGGGVDVEYKLTSAALHMDTGTFSSGYDVHLKGDRVGHVSRDVYALRQYPHVAVQSFVVRLKTLDLQELEDAGDACFFHEVEAPPGAEHTARFDTSFLLTDQRTSVFMFTGESSLLPAASASPTRAAVSTLYLWDPADGAQFEVAGFNVDRFRPGRAFNRVNLYDGKQVTIDGENMREFRFQFVTCSMTENDFENPEEECKRVLLAVVDRGASSIANNGNVLATLRSDHVRKWDLLWATNITVLPKTGITVGEMDRIIRLRRHVRYALYNLYASVRGGADVLFNPGQLGLLDLTGRVAAQGELWFLPCILLLKPVAARAILDARHEALPRATRLASTYGFKGAKFPYAETTSASRYNSAVHWDAVAVTHVFNTAIVGVNAWNYYRITRDKDWLKTRGFPLLQGVANFVASAFELDASTGKYQLVKTVSLDGSRGAMNAFSTNTCLLALKAAIEASYALGLGTQRAWTSVFFNVRPIFFQNAAPLLRSVIRFDADSAPRDPVRIAEPLLVLTPTYSEVLYPNGRNLAEGLIKNFDYYKQAVEDAGTEELPINAALLASTEGLRAQTETERTGEFYARLEEFLDISAEPVWGNLRSYDGRPAQRAPLQGLNDTSTSAMLLLTLLGVTGGVNVVGGVSDTQFMYNELRLSVARNRKMPRSWQGMRLTGLAGGTDSTLILNELRYETS
jgi:hypothetical protein